MFIIYLSYFLDYNAVVTFVVHIYVIIFYFRYGYAISCYSISVTVMLLNVFWCVGFIPLCCVWLFWLFRVGGVGCVCAANWCSFPAVF
jgi:hypothetical protein